MKAPKVVITDHAARRLRKRVGLKKSGCRRLARAALARGISYADASKDVKRYFYKLFLQHMNATNVRIYGEFVFLFSNGVLITVFGLPKGLQAKETLTE